MKSSTHAIVQALLATLQGLNAASLSGHLAFLPPKWSAVAVFALTTLQGAIALYNHYFNPDGTPAKSS